MELHIKKAVVLSVMLATMPFVSVCSLDSENISAGLAKIGALGGAASGALVVKACHSATISPMQQELHIVQAEIEKMATPENNLKLNSVLDRTARLIKTPMPRKVKGLMVVAGAIGAAGGATCGLMSEFGIKFAVGTIQFILSRWLN